MAATHNNLRAATAALSAMATILLAVILLAFRPIPAFAEGGQVQGIAEGNVVLKVTPNLPCAVKADGSVLTPDAEKWSIDNIGSEEVRLGDVTVDVNKYAGPVSLSAIASVYKGEQIHGDNFSWFSYAEGKFNQQKKQQCLQPNESLRVKWSVGNLDATKNAEALKQCASADGYNLATVSFSYELKQAFAVLYDDGSAVLYKRYMDALPVVGSSFDDGTVAGARKVSKVVSNIETSGGIFNGDTNLEKISVADNGIRPTTTNQWFRNCNNLASVDLEKIDTSMVTNMTSMFGGCSKLDSLDLSNFETSKVQCMDGMFSRCYALRTLDFKSFNTSNVKDMDNMFLSCIGLTSLDLSNFDTANVEDMHSMFSGCSNLKTLKLSQSWNTGSVVSMKEMFRECSKLTELDVADWNTGSVKDMGLMFYDCGELLLRGVSEWNTENVMDMRDLFNGCAKLTNLNLAKWGTDKVTNMIGMFYRCANLETITGLSQWNTGEVTNMGYMFCQCGKLKSLDLSGWNTSKVSSMDLMFRGCVNLETLTGLEGQGWNTENVTDMRDMFMDCSKITALQLSGFNTSKVTNMGRMFAGCSGLASLNLSSFDTLKVTNVGGMFSSCSGLEEVTLKKGWNFKFEACGLPKELYVKNGDTYLVYNNDDFPITATTKFYTQKGLKAFAVVYDDGAGGKSATLYKRYVDKMPEPGKLFDDGTGARQVSAVIDDIESDCKAGIFSDSDITAVSAADDDIQPSTMERWFSGCTNLKNVNLSRVDASKVVSMANMFAGCGSLAFLDLSGWDATNVKDMSGMFSACFQLATIKLDGMKVQNVSNLNRMFANCEKLNTLNIPSDWCISKATDKGYTDMGYMFYACKSLKKIDFSKWNISNATNTEYMFYMCSDLSEIAIPSGKNPWRVKGSKDDQSNGNGATLMFGGCSSLLSLDLKNMNVEQVENMSGMFSGCSELTLLDLSGWNASNVKDMSGMFSGCIKLATLKLDSMKVQNASNMDRMFANCENLEMLSIPSDWNTSNVTNMSHMFYACKSIKGLDLSNWNVSSVADMEQMFATCSNLQMLNLANWRTSGNPVANNLLTSCSSIRQIILGAGWSIDFEIAGFPKPLYVIRENQYVALTGKPSLTQETTFYTESYKNEHPLAMQATGHDSNPAVEGAMSEQNASLEASSPRGQLDATTIAASMVESVIDQSANAAEGCCDKHVDYELENLDSNQFAELSAFSLSKRQENISIAA